MTKTYRVEVKDGSTWRTPYYAVGLTLEAARYIASEYLEARIVEE